MKRFFILIILFINVFINSKAQLALPLSYKKTFPIEKLYLTFDKPYYSVGDTLWFKSFLLNTDHTASARTDKIYIELYSDSLKLIESRVIALNNGLGYGDFALDNKLQEGTYSIRAYSNWQQNFGADYFFQKTFYIGNAQAKTWLLDAYQKLNTLGKKTLDLKIRITNLSNEVVGLRDVEIMLMNDKKRLMKADLQTSLKGIIETQTPLGENKINGNYSFIITDKKDRSRQSILPINLQEMDQVDLQFMPEGGYMVNGIFGRVAFKAIGADGLGKDISGKIVNSKNEKQTEFNVTHKGMGSFYLLPTKAEIYTAVYNLNGKEQKQILPAAKEEGTTLRIDHLSKSDTLYVYIKTSDGRKLDGYQLLAQTAEETLVNVKLNLKNGFGILQLPKKDFPDGIIHFTLFSPEANPVNERQVFINRKQRINIQASTNKNEYNLRDSINLEIVATKDDGSPLSGSFAIAVTDDGQVKQANDNNNITSYFLLQSELKGNIEDAAWYFENENQQKLMALDHLLLTQGWIGYNWNQIMSKTPSFKPEKGNSVNGTITGLFNKPREGLNITMLSLGKNIMVLDTSSDSNGNFTFKDLPLLDTAAYTIKIKNTKGKTATGNIMVEEFKRSKLPLEFKNIKPWYINTDSAVLNYFKVQQKQIKVKEREQMVRTGTLLNEVVIKGQVRLKEIIAKEAWDAKFLKEITEEELKKIPQKTLKDLLKETFPNFNIGDIWPDGCAGRPSRHNFASFRIGNSLLSHVIIDKVNTNLVASGLNDNYQETGISLSAKSTPEINYGLLTFDTNNYIFNTLTASEIKNITLYRGCSYYYLDITTRGGQGPWIAPTPGRYIYRPLPIYMAKEFYSPKYTVANADLPDYRSTIYWNANVVTDETGKANLSFYAADKPTTYTVKIEGTDLMGRFGYNKSTIIIKNKSSSK